MVYIQFLTNKSEVLEQFIELVKLLEHKWAPWTVAYFHSDNEWVYTTNAWQEYCREKGIEHEFSPPYRPDAHGVVERANGVVGTGHRCMMTQGNAPQIMATRALEHANTFRNNFPTKANNGWSPLEKQAGMRIPFNRRLIRAVLFCLFYAHIYKAQRSKTGDRAVPCVYIGFDQQNNQFICMEWISGNIHYVGDGEFHNSIFPFRANPTKCQAWMNEYDHVAPQTTVSMPRPASHSLPTGPRRSYRQHSYHYTGGRGVSDIPDDDQPPDIVNHIYARRQV